MSNRCVFSGHMNAVSIEHNDGHGELVPQLSMFGIELADAGFPIGEDIAIIIEDRMLIIVPRSRVGEHSACAPSWQAV